jgi:hypothetical protein
MIFSFLLHFCIVLTVLNHLFLCNGDYLSSTIVKSFSPNSSFPSFYFVYYENNDIFEIPDNYTLHLLSSELPSLSINTIPTVPYQLVPKILKSKGILPSLQQTSSDNTENSRVLLGELVERSLFIQDSSLVYLGPAVWNPSIVYWMGRYLVCWRDISSIYQGQLAFGWLTTDMKQIDSQSYLGIGGTNDEKKIHPIPFFKKPGAIEQEDPRLFLLSNGSLVISFTGFFPNPAKPHVRIGKNIQGYILANYHENENKIVFQEKITIFDYKQGPNANRQKNWIPFEYHPALSSSSSDRTQAASSSSLYFIQNIHQMKIFKTIHQLSSLVPAAPASPFYHDSNYLLGQKIMRGQFEFLPDYWKGVSEDVKDLISHLLDINPKTRYTVDQALKHPWFTSVENTDSQLETHHLGISQLRKFQARKKFRGAIKAIIMIERIKRLLSVKRSSKSFKVSGRKVTAMEKSNKRRVVSKVSKGMKKTKKGTKKGSPSPSA